MTEQNENNNPVEPQQPAQPENNAPQQPVYDQQPAPQQPAYAQQQPVQQQPVQQQPVQQQPAYGQQPVQQQPGYPQAGYQQQPGYPQAGYQQQPGAGYAQMPAQPNSFVESLKAIPLAIKHIWNGRTADLFNTMSSHRLFGPVALGVYVIAASLITSINIARSSFVGASYFGVSMSFWFYTFFMFLIVSSISALLRPLAIMMTLKVRGIHTTYLSCMRVSSVAVLPTMVVMPVSFIFALLPWNFFIFFLYLILCAISIIASIVGEILLYIGVTREGRMQTSPVLPYAVFTVVWLFVVGILSFLVVLSVGMSFMTNLFSTFGSSFAPHHYGF